MFIMEVYMNDIERNGHGRFIRGHKVNLPRDSKGRFIKKDKEKTMDKKQDITTVESRVDEILNKAGL